ncbi:unnamed protein product, partial [Rotaria sp. Silwood2]
VGIKHLADRNFTLDNYVKQKGKYLKYDNLEALDDTLRGFFDLICLTNSTSNSVPPMKNTSSNYSPYYSSNKQGTPQSWNSRNLPTPMDYYINSQQQHMSLQNINPHHHHMFVPPKSMPPYDNQQYPTNLLSSQQSSMIKIMPLDPSTNPNEINLKSGDQLYSSVDLPPLPTPFNPIQQNFYHLSSSQFVKMDDMNASIDPSTSRQQVHVRSSSLINDNFVMTPLSHHSMLLNASQPPPSQKIINSYVPTTISIEQEYKQGIYYGEQADELHTGTLYYHEASEHDPASQQQSHPAID